MQLLQLLRWVNNKTTTKTIKDKLITLYETPSSNFENKEHTVTVGLRLFKFNCVTVGWANNTKLIAWPALFKITDY